MTIVHLERAECFEEASLLSKPATGFEKKNSVPEDFKNYFIKYE